MLLDFKLVFTRVLTLTVLSCDKMNFQLCLNVAFIISEIKKSFLKEPDEIYHLSVFFLKSFMQEQLVAVV